MTQVLGWENSAKIFAANSGSESPFSLHSCGVIPVTITASGAGK